MNDLISRQAAIDVLNSERVEEDGIHYWRVERNKTIDVAVKIIQALPSAELESCEDAISRSEAIKVIEAVPDGNWKSIRYSKEIRRLPSAQPEIVRCKDCKHKPSGSGTNHDFSFPDGVCPCQCEDYWYSWMPKDDWYCADAERRTDE